MAGELIRVAAFADAELYGGAGWASGAAPVDPADESAAPAPESEVSEGWSYVQMMVLFGVLLAIIAAGVRYYSSGPKAAGYEKTMA